MNESLIDALRRYLPLEAKEAEEYIYLSYRCQSALARIIFKILVYDSILHSEIINDLILMLSTRSMDSAYTECINYIRDNSERIIKNAKEEANLLNELENKLKYTDNHLFEALIRYICDDEESHIKLLKALIKEIKS